MINRLKQAIAKTLKKSFPDFTIYIENPTQDMVEPCFIIELISQTQKDLLSFQEKAQVALTNNNFSITLLLPRNQELTDDLITRVLFALKWIEIDGKPQLTLERSVRPIDDSSVNFLIRINRELYLESPYDLMEELAVDERLRYE